MWLEKDTAVQENSTVILWASFLKETELIFFVSLAMTHAMDWVKARTVEAIKISMDVFNSLQMWGKKYAVWNPSRWVWFVLFSYSAMPVFC